MQLVPPHTSIDHATLDFLFPCHFAVDSSLRLTRLGPGLQMLIGTLRCGDLADAVFGLEEEAQAFDLARLQGRPIVLTVLNDARLRFRGAIAPQPEGAVFLVSPVLSDAAAVAAFGATLDTLSPCDGSAELVVGNEMQRILAEEAKALATGLAAARDAAVATKAFFDAILQRLPAALMVKNAADGRYVLVNRCAENVFGLPAADLIGRTARDLFPADQADAAEAEDAQVVATRGLIVDEAAATTTRMGLRYFATQKFATYDQAAARFIITMGEDVTERRRAESDLRDALATAEQANAAKSTFLANMSHEIRTPLNGIVAVTDVLSRLPLGDRERELVRIVQASGKTLERLLSDILDLARIESQQITLEQAPFDLGAMCRSMVDLAKLRADEKGVTLLCRVDPAAEGTVLGDVTRVRQVLTNLLSNAVKFTDKGEVRLGVEQVESGRVRFTVDDSGVGIDAAAQARVFDRFQQADESITRRFGGSGLGLAICRELVQLMDGRIDLRSEAGKGSSFWFEIPLPPSSLQVTVAEVADVGVPSETLARILVADDHPTNRKVLELMLEGTADFVCVENGQEAVDAFATGDFDLILMDMQMPVMDGLAAVRAIRRAEADGAHVPIIMLTANALPEHISASAAAGADLHLSKPITAHSLFAAMEAVSATIPAAASGPAVASAPGG